MRGMERAAALNGPRLKRGSRARAAGVRTVACNLTLWMGPATALP